MNSGAYVHGQLRRNTCITIRSHNCRVVNAARRESSTIFCWRSEMHFRVPGTAIKLKRTPLRSTLELAQPCVTIPRLPGIGGKIWQIGLFLEIRQHGVWCLGGVKKQK